MKPLVKLRGMPFRADRMEPAWARYRSRRARLADIGRDCPETPHPDSCFMFPES
jgi:hypothetical protein